jgi:hypothetical protein
VSALVDPPPRQAGSGGHHIRVDANPTGAAELMRQLYGLPGFNPMLGESNGRWRVDVRGGERALETIVDLIAEAIEHGRLEHATVSVDGQAVTFAAEHAA